jgi:trehalose synthase
VIIRAARDIEGTWDVAVVHGSALAGVAAIGEDKADVWLWQPPCSAPEPGGGRLAEYLARYSGLVGRDNRVGATVDPLATFNMRFPPDVARRVGPLLEIDADRPLLCHVSRFAPWTELDEVIGAYWGAKSVVTDLEPVIGGAACNRHEHGCDRAGERRP